MPNILPGRVMMASCLNADRNTKGWLLAIAAVLSLGSHPTAADELHRLVRLCEKCHGEDGYSVKPEVPIIAGFSREGFHETMESFRRFKRTALALRLRNLPDEYLRMNEIALRLNDDSVTILADYYSALPFKPALQEADEELARRGAAIHDKKCEKCHSENGASPLDDAAILAGQWTPYLRRQFDNILGGKRKVPKRMLRAVRSLSQDDIEALLNFYAMEGKVRAPGTWTHETTR
ncbi:MAG: c-type cytochrome [Gammaproteobacteria bacterium]|nr:c-type cytochrome [Gammaproteobacteria bacterium]